MTEKRRGNEKVSSHVENGDPVNIILLDSRLRGNDKKGCGRQRREVGMTITITMSSHVENGDPVNIILLDSRLRGNDKKGDGNDKKGDGNDKKGCGRQRREAGITVTIKCHLT